MIALGLGQARAGTISDDTFAQIDAAISRGDADEAERLASAALTLPDLSKQDKSQLLSDRALALNLNGRPQEALTDYTSAIRTNALPTADRVNALLERGLLLEMLHHPKEALNDYSVVLRLTPNSAIALNRRANVYRLLGKLDAARDDYLASLKADIKTPEHPYFGLGQIAEARGDTAGARDYYRKSLAANPNFATAGQALGRLSVQTISPPGLAGATPDRSPRIRRLIHPDARRGTIQVVQLGAWRSENEAAGGWIIAEKLGGNLLAGVAPSIVPADLPHKGQYFRLRINVTRDPTQFCESLRSKGVACMPIGKRRSSEQ